MPNDFLNLLSDSRTRIVHMLKARGDVSVEEAARELGLAETTIRQHLDRLDEMGLVEHERVARGPGRPTSRYRLSAGGQRLFPSQDGRLFGQVLDFMLREGYPGLVEAFFQQTWDARAQKLDALMEAAGLADAEPACGDPAAADALMRQKLEIAAEFFREEGFMSRLGVEEGRAKIEHCNCPFSAAVRATKLPCRLEAKLLERALGRTIERTAYMPDGDSACAYEFDSLPE